MAVVLGFSVLFTGAGLGAASFLRSPAEQAAQAAPPPRDTLTAPVEFRVIGDSVVVRGTVVSESQTTVISDAAGTDGTTRSVVSDLKVAAGHTLEAGDVAAEVSGRPIMVLPGRVPAYRDLHPGDQGKDVAQLHKALAAAGHPVTGDAGDFFGEGTKQAVTALYRNAGYKPRPASADADEAVAAAEEAVVEAERSLTEARRTQAGPTATSAVAAPGDEGRSAKELAETDSAVQRAREALAKAQSTLDKERAAQGPMLPAGEVVFVSRTPAVVDTVPVHLGDEAKGPLMFLSSGRRVVMGTLSAWNQGLVRPGQVVQILSETTGFSAKGTVSMVSTADSVPAEGPDPTSGDKGPEAGSGEVFEAAPTAGPTFTVESTKDLPGSMLGRDVRLTISAATSDGKVLVVPLAAVSATADGSARVTVVSQDGAQRAVNVRTGITGDGRVAVTPLSGNLKEGQRVLVGSTEAG